VVVILLVLLNHHSSPVACEFVTLQQPDLSCPPILQARTKVFTYLNVIISYMQGGEEEFGRGNSNHLHSNSRPGERVLRARLVVVDVVVNTGVVGSVELSSRDTAGHRASGSGDAEVDALGVELRIADIESTVEGEDLMAEDVISGLYVGRDPDLPGKTIGDKFVGRPLRQC
jgi:hypothetical protein